MTENQIELVNPNGNETAIAGMRRLLMDKQHEFIAEIDAARSALTETMKLNSFDKYKKMFAEARKRLADEVAEQSGAKAVFVQCAASEAEVDEHIKLFQSELRALKAANEPQAEKHEFIIEIYVTEKDCISLIKRMTKDGFEFRYRRVKDNESAKIGKLFEEVK